MDTKRTLTQEDRTDLDMVMGLILNSLLSEEGVKQINEVMASANDPAAVLAQVVLNAVGGVYDQLEDNGVDVSDKVWTARSGVIDQTLAEVAGVVAGTSGNKSLMDPQVLESAREQVVSMMAEQNGEDVMEQETDDEPSGLLGGMA